MKNLLLLVVFIISGLYLSAQPKYLSMNEALELTKKEPKKIIVDIYTDWCGYCKVMDQQTFGNKEISDYLNKYFYVVKLNAEKKDSTYYKDHTFKYIEIGGKVYSELAVAFLQGQMGYPTLVYLDEKGDAHFADPGFKRPEDLMPVLVYFAEDHYKTTSWDDFFANYSAQKTSGKDKS